MAEVDTKPEVDDTPPCWLGLVYAVTIFVSAFLLFQVQPLISKFILPWFGGTPSVWTTCMLFFQLVLFAGYAYAHLIVGRLSGNVQAVVHIALMLAALWVLPVTPDGAWKPTGDEQPTIRIIILLAVSVGLPFFVLSSTGPLLQGWFSRTHAGSSPYRLYALSNFGSLLALVSYPFVFEPAFASSLLSLIWSWGFVCYAIGCTLCALWMRKLVPSRVLTQPESSAEQIGITRDGLVEGRPTLGTRLMWFSLSMAASVMLLATTNQVCMDVASVPFLWVLPLTIYLLSFILCFDGERWYSRWVFAIGMCGLLVGTVMMLDAGAGVRIELQALVYFSALFFSAMFCHGELVALKPHPRDLTMFYLFISAGGAAGGVFVGILAPYLFLEFIELPLGMLGCVVLMLIVFWRDSNWILHRGRPKWIWGLMLAMLLGFTGYIGYESLENQKNAVLVTRNFYGVLRVRERDDDVDFDDHRMTLTHGRILHGVQFVSDSKRRIPTSYYCEDSGIGLILTSRKVGKPQSVGIVGLGAGTIAAYAEKGDKYRFYDINPQVIDVAQKYFTYLADCQKRGASCELVLGDARLSLEREESQHFDVLVLDAFSSDAIPIHLLTVEAFEIYRKHLLDDGVLAVHISNRHFELRPVVEGLADHFGMTAIDIEYDVPDRDAAGNKIVDEFEKSNSTWVLVSASPSALESEVLFNAAQEPQEKRILWTDDRNNLFEVLSSSD